MSPSFADLISFNNELDFFPLSVDLIFASILSTYKLVSGAVHIFLWRWNELRLLSQIGNTEQVFSKFSLFNRVHISVSWEHFSPEGRRWARTQSPLGPLASEVAEILVERTLRLLLTNINRS